jgi:hypothetical protein
MILPPSLPGGHTRAVREGDWTYRSGLDYELYNVRSDPLQLDNLLYQRPPSGELKKE